MSEEADVYSWLDPEGGIRSRFKGRAREVNVDNDMLMRGHSNLRSVLDQLHYDNLRLGQGEAVWSLMRGHDVHCVLPTSMGKTAIYVVPTLCLGWRTLIFSPLVSLMKDQVENLYGMGLKAAQISSGQNRFDNMRSMSGWETGDINFLLVAPERIEMDDFMNVMKRCKPQMVTVDEAHCLSQWGDSFRPSYLGIGDFIHDMNPRVVTTLTATATRDVEEDIRTVLGIPQAKRVIHYPKRENLIHSTITGMDQSDLLDQINAIEGPVVVYCGTRRRCEELAGAMGRNIKGNSLYYHAGMTKDQRTTNQDHFMDNVVRVMFATKAFGLGVNKPDIRGVIHWDVSGSIEELVQEQGRAGRDGKNSDCVMCFDKKSMGLARWMVETTFPEKEDIEKVYHSLERLTDKDGKLQLTLEDIAKRINIDGKVVGSCVGILKACGVLDRSKEQENPARIKILARGDHHDPSCKVLLDQLKHVGRQREDGFYEVGMSNLADACCLKPSTVSAKLKAMQEDHYVEFNPPFRGKTTKIVGSLSMVDFGRINKRRAEGLNKVDEVERFVMVPDNKKHDFLLKYFGVDESAAGN